MRRTASVAPATAAAMTPCGGPTNVATIRWWSGSAEESTSWTPGVAAIALVIAAIVAASRPSLKFGTHWIAQRGRWKARAMSRLVVLRAGIFRSGIPDRRRAYLRDTA